MSIRSAAACFHKARTRKSVNREGEEYYTIGVDQSVACFSFFGPAPSFNCVATSAGSNRAGIEFTRVRRQARPAVGKSGHPCRLRLITADPSPHPEHFPKGEMVLTYPRRIGRDGCDGASLSRAWRCSGV